MFYGKYIYTPMKTYVNRIYEILYVASLFCVFSHQFAIMNISLNFYSHIYISLMTEMISLFDVYGFTYDILQKRKII